MAQTSFVCRSSGRSRHTSGNLIYIILFLGYGIKLHQGFTLHNMEFGKRMMFQRSSESKELSELMTCVNNVQDLLQSMCQRRENGLSSFNTDNLPRDQSRRAQGILNRGADYQDMEKSLELIKQCCTRDCGFESLYKICKG